MMNLFEKAISKNELLEFAIGEDEYFVLDREFDEHSVIISWKKYILPLMKEKSETTVNPFIEAMILQLINDKRLGIEKRNDLLLYHLHVYYYLRKEGKISGDVLNQIHLDVNSSLNNYLNYLQLNKNIKFKDVQDAIALIKSRGGLVTL